MRSDEAYIVPKADTSIDGVDDKAPMFERFKELFKMLTPNNTDLTPKLEFAGATTGPTVIDNSVKSVNQNNQNQSMSLNSKNTDASFNFTNKYRDV